MKKTPEMRQEEQEDIYGMVCRGQREVNNDIIKTQHEKRKQYINKNRGESKNKNRLSQRMGRAG